MKILICMIGALSGFIFFSMHNAEANSVSENFFESMGEEVEIALITSSVVFGTAGVVFGIANHLEISSDDRPNSFWLTGGYASGGVNLALGIFYVIGASISMTGDTSGSESWLWLGIGHIVVGGTDVALSIWGSCMEEETITMSVLPIIGLDNKARPIIGATLNIVSW